MTNKALASFDSTAFSAASKQVVREQKVLLAALSLVQSNVAAAKAAPHAGRRHVEKSSPKKK